MSIILMLKFDKVYNLQCHRCIDCGKDPAPMIERCCDAIGVDAVCMVSTHLGAFINPPYSVFFNRKPQLDLKDKATH